MRFLIQVSSVQAWSSYGLKGNTAFLRRPFEKKFFPEENQF